jgi:transposase
MINNRISAFRDLKKAVRGSDSYLLVGIDVAKDRHHAFFGTPNGKTLLRNLVFDNNKAGFEILISQARTLRDRHGLREAIFAVEPTASYHKPLGEYLIRSKEHVVYVSNLAVKKNRELLDGRWDKHDKKDAANVADLVGQGKCLYYDVPEETLHQLRSLLAYRMRLKKQEQGLRVRIRNHLFAQYFPELDRLYMQKGQPDDIALSIAEHCLDPQEIAAMEFEEFLKLILRRKIRIVQERRLRDIWEAAKNSSGCRVYDAAKWEARTLVEQVRNLMEMIKELEARVEATARQFPEYGHLLSIPGFGPRVSAMVLAAIGDPSRFENHKQVLRLAGLDLVAARSGKNSEKITPLISKQGKAVLRYALVQAATVAARTNVSLADYFNKLLKGRELERGIQLKMKVKMAAKLLVIAWTLMRRREDFKASCFAA